MQGRYYNNLWTAIDLDIERLENSIADLQKSLTSLAKVVLRNKRVLGLAFFQQGGLCAALGEECCFYADHPGVAKESLARVREGLSKRKKEMHVNKLRAGNFYLMPLCG